ncbi:MAG: zinc ribbon domain-containing protein [Ruminococcaceae bacterium]|nr:zinc ribbon domain-containing protein [Oscillospiraceae bacterium]
MKISKDIIVRILAVVLIAFFFLPFVSIYDAEAKEDYEYYDELYNEYEDEGFAKARDMYIYKDKVSLFEFTFGKGKILAEEYPENYGISFAALMLPLLALALAILGTKFRKTSIALASIHAVWTCYLVTHVSDMSRAIIAGEGLGDQYIPLITESVTIDVAAFAVIGFLVNIALIVMCIKVKGKKKIVADNIPHPFTPTPKAAIPGTIVCPVCENHVEEGEMFCGICGSPVSTVNKMENKAPSYDNHYSLDAVSAKKPMPEPKVPETVHVASAAAINKNICPNCNADVEGTSVFCFNCGFMLNGTSPSPKREETIIPDTTTEDYLSKHHFADINEAHSSCSDETHVGLKSTMRTKPSESPEEAAKKAAGQSFFNKPSDL